MRIRLFGALLMATAVALFGLAFLDSQGLPNAAMAQGGAGGAGPDIKGLEVQARGPIHEAFATPSAEAKPTYGVPKKPPEPIEEMPPEEKPEGNAVWIGGYWAWDDDRADFLWVSGCWRVKPPGKDWVSGYWREVSGQHQWVPGLWATVEDRKSPEVTYYPEPPPPPQMAAPAAPAEPDMFYVPGYWMWAGDHYVWRAGYYTRIRSGYVYIPSHYRWTPLGFVFVPGYWDYTVASRGVLYAPVVVDTVVVGPRFVYTPYYAVSDAIVVDAFFVRPGFCHYYFGDYYGPRYAAIGFECGFVYSRAHYEPIVVYSRWEYRNNPAWFEAHVNLTFERNAGRAPLPPRTLVQQTNITNVTVINNNTNIYKNTVLAPTKTVVASRGAKTVALDQTARLSVKEAAVTHQKVAIAERAKTELVPHGTVPANKPHTAAVKLPNTTPSPTALHGASSPTNAHVPTATNAPKNLENHEVKDKQPLNSKTPGIGAAGKGNPHDITAPPGNGRPMLKGVPPLPDHSPPAKKSSDDNKKKQ